MKNLVRIVIAVMLVASPAFAALGVIYEEDFTGTAGANITTLGWTQDSTGTIDISDTVIDVTQSAKLGDRDAVGDIFYTYDFPDVTIPDAPTATPDEYFQLTLATRAMQDIVYVRLNGRTHHASNAPLAINIGHEDNVWAPFGNPEKITMSQANPYVSASSTLAGEDGTVWLRLIAHPGVNGPTFPNPADPGWSTLSYSETSASGPWTDVHTDPLGGLWRVDSLQIIGGYGVTGWVGHNAGFLDSIKLEVLPEPATLVMLALGGLAMLKRRR